MACWQPAPDQSAQVRPSRVQGCCSVVACCPVILKKIVACTLRCSSQGQWQITGTVTIQACLSQLTLHGTPKKPLSIIPDRPFVGVHRPLSILVCWQTTGPLPCNPAPGDDERLVSLWEAHTAPGFPGFTDTSQVHSLALTCCVSTTQTHSTFGPTCKLPRRVAAVAGPLSFCMKHQDLQTQLRMLARDS